MGSSSTNSARRSATRSCCRACASARWTTASSLPTTRSTIFSASRAPPSRPRASTTWHTYYCGCRTRRARSRLTSGAPALVEQTHARHVLVKTSEIVSEADARRKLNNLRERIVNGADFGELAKLNSDDASSIKGGDLGWIYPGDTVPEFERVMNSLKVGQLSEPFVTSFGWHLMQVLDG